MDKDVLIRLGLGPVYLAILGQLSSLVQVGVSVQLKDEGFGWGRYLCLELFCWELVIGWAKDATNSW